MGKCRAGKWIFGESNSICFFEYLVTRYRRLEEEKKLLVTCFSLSPSPGSTKKEATFPFSFFSRKHMSHNFLFPLLRYRRGEGKGDFSFSKSIREKCILSPRNSPKIRLFFLPVHIFTGSSSGFSGENSAENWVIKSFSLGNGWELSAIKNAAAYCRIVCLEGFKKSGTKKNFPKNTWKVFDSASHVSLSESQK